METEPRTQTAFRLKDSLLQTLKWKAKKANMSLNAYVEETLEEAAGQELKFPKFSQGFFEENRAYIGKKYKGFNLDIFRKAMNELLARTNVSSIDCFDMRSALQDPEIDLEDNAQIAFAHAQRCDIIVTNDRKLLSRTLPAPMIAMTTEDFLSHCR